MSNFSHIIYTFIFSTIPLLFISIRHRQKLYDNRKVILYILLLVLIYAILAETVAMKMGLWYHDKEKVLNIPFGDPIDDILVAPITSFILSSIIIVFSEFEERGKNLSEMVKLFLGLN